MMGKQAPVGMRCLLRLAQMADCSLVWRMLALAHREHPLAG